jgi:sodium-dependent dicarboxylate transporter 2/3/5
MSRAEKTVAGLLCAVAAGWMLRPVIDGLAPGLRLSDAGIVMTAAIALFMIPSGAADRAPLLTWDDATRLPWGVLILFGGGLALAKAITASGLAAWLGDALSALGALPLVAVVLTVAVVVVYLGELASNTAMAAIFLPIAGAVAIGLGHDPVTLALPVALAASIGFMLPVATPPNAIVFASGTVTARQMLRAGFLLDMIGIAVVVAVAMTTAAWVLGRA